MPLTACAGCGRGASPAAPGCIHCGRPPAEPASPPASAPERTVPEIVAALVLGTLRIIRVLRRELLARTGAGGSRGGVGGVVAIGTVIQVAPWLLYLYLFRKSRYP